MTPAELHLAYQDESSIRRLTSSAPPTVQNVREYQQRGRTVYEVMLEEEPADRIGQSLSAEMVALVGGIRADFVSYGPRHPIRRAMAEYDRMCRRRHRLPSWRDHASVGLCGNLLRDVIEGGASVRWCAERYGLSWPRAERLIVGGLNFVGERYERQQEDRLGLVHDAEHCPTCIAAYDAR